MADLLLLASAATDKAATDKPATDKPATDKPVADILGCCILCCTQISNAPLEHCVQNRRRKSLTSLRQFVTQRCRPTPYAYSAFAGLHGEERALLCIPCVNWQRRCVRWRGAQKPLLLIDQLILFMLEPGKTPVPDQRCALRLMRSLRRRDGDCVSSLLLGAMPTPVQAILFSLPESVFDGRQLATELVRAWWDYNGRTSFLSHHMTAKLVRRLIKRDAAGGGSGAHGAVAGGASAPPPAP